MAEQSVDHQTYCKTRHRGLSYRNRLDGSRIYFGYVPGVGRRRLDATGEREALAEYGELRGRASKGEKMAPRNVRFGDVAASYLEAQSGRLRPWTLKLYRGALDNEILPRFGHRKLAEIDAEEIARFIRRLHERGLSSSTIENYLLPLKGTFALACRRGLLGSNPCSLLTAADRPPKRERRKTYEWSDEEVEAMLAGSRRVAAKPESRFDYSPLIESAVEDGLRLGELLGLKWEDVDLDAAVLHVRRQIDRMGNEAPPKTRKAVRRVPLPAHRVAFYRRLKLGSRFSQDGDYVFASRKGTALTHRNVQRRGFEPARDEADLPKTLTFHDLRHAFASRAAHQGVSLFVLADVMGHEDVETTRRTYVHLFGREQAEDAFRVAMAR